MNGSMLKQFPSMRSIKVDLSSICIYFMKCYIIGKYRSFVVSCAHLFQFKVMRCSSCLIVSLEVHNVE